MGFSASSQRNHKNADLSDGFDSFEHLIFSNFKSNVIEVNYFDKAVVKNFVK